MKKLLRTALLTGFFILLTLPATAQERFSDALCGLAPRAVIGEAATVAPGASNNVRSIPLVSGDRVGRVSAGETFQILNGPVCGDGYTWWQIEYEAIIGWTAASNQTEYFITPQNAAAATDEVIAYEFNGFELSLPLSVADGVQGAFVNSGNPVEGTSNASPATRYPPYVEFTFEGYTDTTTMQNDTPFIRVYTVESFDPLETQAGIQARQTIRTLSNIFNSGSPDVPTTDTYQPGNIPDFSPGVGQAMLAQVDYVDFQDGRGLRFLTGYTQGAPLVNNTTLVYRYQGITADGAYFIDAHFPLDAPQNPPEPPEDPNDPFAVPEGYEDSLRTFYNNYLPDDYTPPLTALDRLIESFDVPQPPSRG
jgi:hypothetical protein